MITMKRILAAVHSKNEKNTLVLFTAEQQQDA